MIPTDGPALANFKVADVSATNSNGSSASHASAIASTATAVSVITLTASNKDAAVLMTLTPGSYTAVVSGVGATTGTALVELYVVP